ncbi:MAG: type II toxin-antitoxin system VapC family toxin [Actinobacteria bacterium]|nr:type II toxin-antitoxin system VapC family toxin [Actinomycetota bacterium]
MGLIYLDSCILIYALEDASTRGDAVRSRLARTEHTLAISPLVMLECLVGPIRAADLALRDRYQGALERCDHINLGVPEYERAAELRARHGLRTPDALHLAAAQLGGCTQLWTNDARLAAASKGLAVDVVAGDWVVE